MKRFLTAGTFGDVAMSMAKLAAIDVDEYVVHHLTKHENIKPILEEFYISQDISHQIFIVDDSIKWSLYNVKNYDAYLGTHWHKDNNIIESWEINPFPNIKYEKVDADTVLMPMSGRDMTRRFDLQEIGDLSTKMNLTFVGHTDEDSKNYIDTLGDSRINKTSVQDLINIICSCNTFIGHSGFGVFLAGMARKKVYCVSEGLPTENRVHPDWDVTYITSLSDI